MRPLQNQQIKTETLSLLLQGQLAIKQRFEEKVSVIVSI